MVAGVFATYATVVFVAVSTSLLFVAAIVTVVFDLVFSAAMVACSYNASILVAARAIASTYILASIHVSIVFLLLIMLVPLTLSLLLQLL